MKYFALALAASLASIVPAAAQTAPPPAAEEWPEAWFEIFKLVPGKQEEFVRLIHQTDQINAAAGLPPTQMFFHENGADFDVILFKPSIGELTAQQQASIAAKRKELGKPSGPAYFIHIRKLIAEHTDSKSIGPISANMWLKRLEDGRAADQAHTASEE